MPLTPDDRVCKSEDDVQQIDPVTRLLLLLLQPIPQRCGGTIGICDDNVDDCGATQ